MFDNIKIITDSSARSTWDPLEDIFKIKKSVKKKNFLRLKFVQSLQNKIFIKKEILRMFVIKVINSFKRIKSDKSVLTSSKDQIK